jgi:hypothetical protein
VSFVALLATFALAQTGASARVPASFVGVNIDGPLFYPAMDVNGQMNLMVSSGVESMRMLFDWAGMQPYKNFAAVPPSLRGVYQNGGGVPTNFTRTDAVVRLAAIHRLTLLAQIEYAPAWDALHPGSTASPPRTPGPYAQFLRALVGRYGPRGSFWATNPGIPRVPIRMWQIWNEPNFKVYWSQQPWQRTYLKLIRAAHNAVKAADPGAKIVLAGLANYSWQYLTRLYKAFGRERRLFDVVAIHPFTHNPRRIITILRNVRAVMNRAGDRNKPIVADEFSWPSAKGQATTTFETATTEAGQAQKIGQAVRLLSQYRRSLKLVGFYYYTWIGNETPPAAHDDQFNYAGLLRFLDGRGIFAKPALGAFSRAALAIEGCARKILVATNCVR